MDLYALARPALRFISPESAHGLAISALKTGLMPAARGADDAILKVSLWGRDFPNPLGLAAGFDKHAEVLDALFGLGFGFVEAGSVTPRPQAGNARPRLFRLDEDEGVINRFGFNSEGLQPFTERLARRRGTGIVGVNLGKNKETEDAAEDYEQGIAATAAHADYLVCNLSSPNTPGLRALQAQSAMRALVERAITARDAATAAGKRPPLLVKIAPDLDDAALEDVCAVALGTGVDGVILGNTTISRPASLRSAHKDESGGLSGRPLFALSTERLRAFAKMTQGRIPLIGCGGVSSGADAYAKIRAGATLVQLYSALVFGGPGLVCAIKRDLAARLKADGFRSVAEAVGADLR